ncbi:energy-coupling factor ABC transporter ATP-binding protein [Patescibacteria group bacterium]|nr:energy-coupling factor ABC transporter ATP-binding protein [Patescibacteria group bacterium]
MNPGIVFSRVSFSYTKNQPVLKNLSFQIKPGGFFTITGRNGSGKSTLTYMLNGLIPHQIKGYFQGKVTIDSISTREKPVSFFAAKVGLVFQNPDFSLFNLTVKDELAFGLKNLHQDNIDQKIKRALEQVRMLQYLNRDPQSLSFGQKQKICLACALALNPDYLVLDEPTAMLDHPSAVELYQILTQLNQQGKTIIVVEHHQEFIDKFSKNTLTLHV